MVWHKVDAWIGPRIIIEREYRGDIPIGGVIILPMIIGGDIYQMHT
jgi:hypothetical protein